MFKVKDNHLLLGFQAGALILLLLMRWNLLDALGVVLIVGGVVGLAHTAQITRMGFVQAMLSVFTVAIGYYLVGIALQMVFHRTLLQSLGVAYILCLIPSLTFTGYTDHRFQPVMDRVYRLFR